MNAGPSSDARQLGHAYPIGWLEATWLELRRYSGPEYANVLPPDRRPIEQLAKTLPEPQGTALLELRDVIARVMASDPTGRDQLIDYVDRFQDDEFFFAAVADIERCFGLRRYGGELSEAQRVLGDLELHAHRVGDLPVAIQLSVPPRALQMATDAPTWIDALQRLETIDAAPRLMAELRVQMLETVGRGLEPGQQLDHGMRAAEALPDGSVGKIRALEFAKKALLALNDHQGAAEVAATIAVAQSVVRGSPSRGSRGQGR